MCKCTPEIQTPFCGRGDCLPPASREPTESLFEESVKAHMTSPTMNEIIDRLADRLAGDRGTPVCEQYAYSSIRRLGERPDRDCYHSDDACAGVWERYAGEALAVLWNNRRAILAALKAGQAYADAEIAWVKARSDDDISRAAAGRHAAKDALLAAYEETPE